MSTQASDIRSFVKYAYVVYQYFCYMWEKWSGNPENLWNDSLTRTEVAETLHARDMPQRVCNVIISSVSLPLMLPIATIYFFGSLLFEEIRGTTRKLSRTALKAFDDANRRRSRSRDVRGERGGRGGRRLGCWCGIGHNVRHIAQQAMHSPEMYVPSTAAEQAVFPEQDKFCPVCYGPFESSSSFVFEDITTEVDNVVSLKCGHVFHTGCIGAWIESRGQINVTCPLCRTHLEKEELDGIKSTNRRYRSALPSS